MFQIQNIDKNEACFWSLNNTLMVIQLLVALASMQREVWSHWFTQLLKIRESFHINKQQNLGFQKTYT